MHRTCFPKDDLLTGIPHFFFFAAGADGRPPRRFLPWRKGGPTVRPYFFFVFFGASPSAAGAAENSAGRSARSISSPSHIIAARSTT
jgi:hypothetical protein